MTVDSQRPECTPITRHRFLFCAWAKYKLTVRDWKIGNTKIKTNEKISEHIVLMDIIQQ